MAKDKVEIEIALKNANKAIGELKKFQKQTEDTATKSEGVLGGIKKNWLAIGAAVAIASKAIRKAFDMSKEAAQFAQSMDAAKKQFGKDGNEIIKRLNEVAKGTISNADLIQNANRVMSLNVTRDLGQMAQLLEVARFRAQAMGITTSQAFNDIATGIGRQCLVPETMVLMSDSTEKQIIDVVAGDIVKGYKDGQLIDVKVERNGRNGYHDVYEIEFETGETVISTENHRYLINGKWKYLKDIKIGEYGINKDLINTKVVNKRFVKQSWVYDLYVPEVSNFIGNGIVLHNSPLILDNLGIITAGWDKEAKAAGVAYDQQFLLNKILQQGQADIKAAGGVAETTADSYQRFTAEAENLRLKIGNELIPIFADLFKGINVVYDKLSDLFGLSMPKTITGIDERIAEYEAEGKNIDLLLEKRKELFKERLKENKIDVSSNKALKEAAANIKKNTDGLKESLKIDYEKAAVLQEQIDSPFFNGKQKRELDRLNTRILATEQAIDEGALNYANTLMLIEDTEVKITAQKEKQQEVTKEMITDLSGIKFDMGLIDSRAGNIQKSFTEMKDTLNNSTASAGAKANVIVAIILAIVEAVQQFGRSLNELGGKIRDNDKLIKVFGQDTTSAFASATQASGQFITNLGDNAKKGIPPLIAIIKTIRDIGKAQDEIAENVGKGLADTLKTIQDEVAKAQFEARQREVDEWEAAAVRRAEIESGLSDVIRREEQDRLDDLKQALMNETDEEKKTDIQRQIDRIKAAEDFEKRKQAIEEQAAAKRAEIKKQEFEFDKANRIAQIQAQKQIALAEAESIIGKRRRDAAKDRINSTYSDILSTIQGIAAPQYAQGTSYSAGGTALVGERGPELVNLPQGSQVIPNQSITNNTDSRNINITVQANDPIELVNQLRQTYGLDVFGS